MFFSQNSFRVAFYLSFVYLAASCGSATFFQTKKKPLPRTAAVADPVEETETPEEEQPEVTGNPNPAPTTPVVVPPPPAPTGKGKGETPTPTPVDPTLIITALNHDALYKNCLYFRVSGEVSWDKVACTKESEVGESVPIPMAPGCQELEVKIETLKPANQNDCIRKLQADRSAICEYPESNVINTANPIDQPERYRLIYTEGGVELSFEDKEDGDFNDLKFMIAGDRELDIGIAGTEKTCDF